MADTRRWLKRLRPHAEGATTLLCLHHAGGNAASFREWVRLLPETITPVAVQLPGRADRMDEPPHEDMDDLVLGLLEALEPLLDEPFAVFGASMGARVGWSLAHALRERSLPQPRALYVYASAAPSLDREVRGWNGPDEGLVRYMREMGGTPLELLEDPELLGYLVAVLRADLTVLSTHTYQPDVRLDLPVTAFAGRDDLESTPAQIAPWAEVTTGPFALHTMDGGHFLDEDGLRLVTRTVTADLSATTPRSAR